MTDELKKGDTLNVISDAQYFIERVTDKAVLIIVRTNNEMQRVSKWIPKSVINILHIDKNLTSVNGNVYRVREFPYFIRRNW
jgi:hypothetical protein